MRRLAIITAFAMVLGAVSVAAALAVTPGSYTPTSGSFNPANAPGSSHLSSGTVQCVVNSALDVNCSRYSLGGVGHTNADVTLSATYSGTIDCTNHGGNVVETHTATFSAGGSTTLTSSRNGSLTVPSQSASAGSAPQVCPNPNWTPSIRPGTLVLQTFDYTLTFAGFSSPYIEITASDP